MRYAITGPLTTRTFATAACAKRPLAILCSTCGHGTEISVVTRQARRGSGQRPSSHATSAHLRHASRFAYDESKNIAVAIGSLDNPAAVAPEQQYGIEAMLPPFASLHTLPGTRTEDDIKPEDLVKLKSLQHPDHD